MNEVVKSEETPVTLNRGEIFCKECGGMGLNPKSGFTNKCSSCSGSGKKDWLEEILINFTSNNIH